jgi:hypothetical protein
VLNVAISNKFESLFRLCDSLVGVQSYDCRDILECQCRVHSRANTAHGETNTTLRDKKTIC